MTLSKNDKFMEELVAYLEAEEIVREDVSELNRAHDLSDGDMEFVVNDSGKLEVYICGQQV